MLCWSLVLMVVALVAGQQVIVVDDLSDSGPTSLRAALLASNGHMGMTIVHVNVAGTIVLDTSLPNVTSSTHILGNGIAIDCTNLPGAADCLMFGFFAVSSRVQDLTIHQSPGNGVVSLALGFIASNVTVQSSGGSGIIVFGNESKIVSCTVQSNGGDGIQLLGDSSSAILCKVFNNDVDGVYCNAEDCFILDCFIGTDENSSPGLGNENDGINLGGTFGHVTDTVVANNGRDGVGIYGVGNLLTKNLIGVGADGSPVGNSEDGIFISGRAPFTFLVNNTISSNGRHGVLTLGSDTTFRHNRIGTDSTGMLGRGNQEIGVSMQGDEADFGPGNIVSDNSLGILIQGNNVTVHRSYFGIDASGEKALPNGFGVSEVSNVAFTTFGPGNVVSGHERGAGGSFSGSDGQIFESIFGLNAAGTQALPNLDGARVFGPRWSIRDSLFSGNIDSGLYIETSDVSVEGCKIGTDVEGLVALANQDGILVGPSSNLLVTHCLLSGNSEAGMALLNGGVTIRDSLIGTDVNGTGSLPNRFSGVFIDSSTDGATIGPNNTIGGTIPIGDLGGHGLIILGSDIRVLGNAIGLDITRTRAMPNAGHGIRVDSVATEVSISDNVIAASAVNGIEIEAKGVTVTGNLLGLASAEGSVLSNGGHGIAILAVANDTVVGPNNTISASGKSGISVSGANTLIYDNFIGAGAAFLDNFTAAAERGNSEAGITVTADASGDLLIGASYQAGRTIPSNVFLANAGPAISVAAEVNATVLHNRFQGNVRNLVIEELTATATLEPLRPKLLTEDTLTGTLVFPEPGTLLVEVFSFEVCSLGPENTGEGVSLGVVEVRSAEAGSQLVDVPLPQIPDGHDGLTTSVTYLPWQRTSAMFACTASGSQQEACDLCTCSGPVVDCSNLGLIFIPDAVPSDVEELRLDHNLLFDATSLTTLLDGNFSKLRMLDLSANELSGDILQPLSKITALESISLSGNQLERLLWNASDFPSLKTLNVSHMMLSELSMNSFASDTLQQVDLSFNELTRGAVDHAGFSNASQLVTLLFSNNLVTSLGDDMFNGASRLEQLDLASNQVSAISSQAFRGLDSIRAIDLGNQQDSEGNPLRIVPMTQFTGLPNLLAARWPTEECPAGFGLAFSDDVSQFVCLRCPEGSYKPASAELYAQCMNCAAGQSDEDSDPSTPCSVCAPGTHAPAGSAGSCASLQCAAGLFDEDLNPATPCVECDPGTHAAVGTSGVCPVCSQGESDHDFRSDTPCIVCGAGTYTAAKSVGDCSRFECPAGTADHDLNSSTPCIPCDVGSYTAPGSSGPCSDFLCQSGTEDHDKDPATPCTDVVASAARSSERKDVLIGALAGAWLGLLCLILLIVGFRKYSAHRQQKRLEKRFHVFIRYASWKIVGDSCCLAATESRLIVILHSGFACNCNRRQSPGTVTLRLLCDVSGINRTSRMVVTGKRPALVP